MSSHIRVASFDPGKKNFAFYVEEFNVDALDTLKQGYNPSDIQYNANGTPTDSYNDIIENVCTNGTNIIFKNTDLTSGCNNGKYFDTECLYNLTDLLDTHTHIWDTCHIFIIEKQMSFGKRHNTMALKIAQHCWSYFSFKYGRFKQIIEFPAYHKTQILGAIKIEKKLKKGKTKFVSVDKPTRKKWSIQKATHILEKRKDTHTLHELCSSRKRDDLADVLCQLQAFKIMSFITCDM